MATTTFEHINKKLKKSPDFLIHEVEKYIDFLTYKHAQETNTQEIPKWHKDVVLKRMDDKQPFEDAFDMLQNLD